MDSPCMCCDHRNAECHSICEVYKQFRIDLENHKAEEKAKRRVWQALNAYELETVRRNYKAKWNDKRKKGV